MNIREKSFGSEYNLITLENQQGTTLSVTDLGARITSWKIPTSSGLREIVLGFDTPKEYLEIDPYIGASIGRVAGRIENGKFMLGNNLYQAKTDDVTGHVLHNFPYGFEINKWSYEVEKNDKEASVSFFMKSPANENAFPGNLNVEVTYTLTQENTWRLITKGVSDEDTLFNPTNHVYFNLDGDITKPIDEHTLQMNSSHYAPLSPDIIPIGKKQCVTDTPFDFRKGKKMVELFESDDDQINQFGGLDHPFFIDDIEKTAVCFTSEDKKISLSIETDASSMVLFSANFGENGPEMRGKKLVNHGGITFETQTAPGADQFPEFGSIMIESNQPFCTITEFHIDN